MRLAGLVLGLWSRYSAPRDLKATIDTLQAIRDQMEADRKVVDLLQKMDDMYSFVNRIDDLSLDAKFIVNVADILNQTVECAHFIQQYANHSFASTSLSPCG